MRMAAVISGVACLLTAAAAFGAEDAFALPKAEGEGELAVEARFTIDGVAQFVATSDAVIASARHEGRLVAWKPDGTLLWKADYPRAYRLAAGDGEIALAFDDGTLQPERGIIWVDAATGLERRRVKLEGRPCLMQYYPQARRWVLVVMPQHRLRTLEGAWMEVVGYGANGEMTWTWKYDCTELAPLRMDGKALVVLAYGAGAKEPAVVRLDPQTGRELWRAGWDPAKPAPTEAEGNPPGSLASVVLCAGWKAVKFLDLGTGNVVRSLALPEMPRAPFWAVGHDDRFYRTCDDLKGVTLAAYRFPSGERIWADETGTVCYGGPVAWKENVVFFARKLSEGLTGRLTLAELRVYGPQGKLLSNIRCEYDPRKPSSFLWNDVLLPQVIGDRLYVASNAGILALRLNK